MLGGDLRRRARPTGSSASRRPYPVVVIHHGFIAQMTHHRYNAQAFAEAGYLAVVVNGTHPVTGAPNVQRNVNGGLVLDWLASDASGEIGDEADLDRVRDGRPLRRARPPRSATRATRASTRSWPGTAATPSPT